MQCDKCGKEPVIFQQYSGRHLCREHAVADIEARIKRDIRANRWMQPGDHLTVVLTGSKSSRALLSFFYKLTAQRRDIRLSAIVIDEGIAGYRDLPRITGLAEDLGIPCHCGSFREAFGMTMDAVARNGDAGSPCSQCREHRYALTETIARREGITRIISAGTLEDKATGILENILLGQVENLLPGGGRKSPVPWIDPLGSVPRAEADLYADIRCPGSETPRCPYRETGFSDEIGDVLETYTRAHPATPYSIAVIGKTLTKSCEHGRRAKEERLHAA